MVKKPRCPTIEFIHYYLWFFAHFSWISAFLISASWRKTDTHKNKAKRKIKVENQCKDTNHFKEWVLKHCKPFSFGRSIKKAKCVFGYGRLLVKPKPYFHTTSMPRNSWHVYFYTLFDYHCHLSMYLLYMYTSDSKTPDKVVINFFCYIMYFDVWMR